MLGTIITPSGKLFTTKDKNGQKISKNYLKIVVFGTFSVFIPLKFLQKNANKLF